ncbi:hypothetical protein TRFO_18299 [Tritrichomonas foetus]|uniref:Uncharacterized protein n=1 Tax=Tritrichomonas foetus TaxID=1144522 RepID=A0A1J4KLA4_9EUKA|nr:hypothetical protein TRFO_18299 [Tritrichomonas foetus]|eukprot:OHT12011.1 hypothetical protein TRFO_18299 [Tritrichomonas foetus]
MTTLTGCENLGLFLNFGFIPSCVTIANLIFIAMAYDPLQSISSPTNIIFIVAIIVVYFEGACSVYIYNKSINSFHRRLLDEKGAILLVCLFHPFYYLVTLPSTMLSIVHVIGTPKNIWNRIACSENCYISSLHTIQAHGMNCITCKHFYIGIPFFFVLIFYSLFFIVLTPLVFLFCSSICLGPLGIAIHLCIRDEFGFVDSFWHSINQAHILTVLFFALTNSIPSVVICAAYVASVASTWPSYLLISVCILNVLCAIPCCHILFTSRGIKWDAKKQPHVSTKTSSSIQESSTNTETA